MRSWNSLVAGMAMACALAVIAPVAAGAAPALGGVTGDREAGLPLTLVHGCHRSAQDSLDGWHRHVGPWCETVMSGPGERNPYSRCRTRCRYVGPIKQCRRQCW